jgi:phage FluMu protein Com
MDVRCKKCNKLLGKIDGIYEIKCPRCGEINTSYFDKEKILKSIIQFRIDMAKSGIIFDNLSMQEFTARALFDGYESPQNGYHIEWQGIEIKTI